MFVDVPRERWDTAGAFWSAATGWDASPVRGDSGQFLTLVPRAGASWVKLQAIDGPARVHVDLDSVDRARGVQVSLDAGAVPAWTYRGVPVMRSPGGLLLCHTIAGPESHHLDRSGDVVLDQVCIDIPPRLWDVEVDFWQRVTGRGLVAGSLPEFLGMADVDDLAGAPRVLLQRLGTEAESVSAHPDFAVHDRATVRARHESLGAEVVEEHPFWTVLRAPTDHLYCLTDRNPATGVLR